MVKLRIFKTNMKAILTKNFLMKAVNEICSNFAGVEKMVKIEYRFL